MHPYLTEKVAFEHRQDMLRAAQRYSLKTGPTVATTPDFRRRRFASAVRTIAHILVQPAQHIVGRRRDKNTLGLAVHRISSADPSRSATVASEP